MSSSHKRPFPTPLSGGAKTAPISGRFISVRSDAIPAGVNVTLRMADAIRLGLISETERPDLTEPVSEDGSPGRISRAPSAKVKRGLRQISPAKPEPAISKSAFEPGFRAKALLKGRGIAGEDLRLSGGTYSLEETRKLLGDVTRQAVETRVRKGSLLAVPGPSNKRRYPFIQFKDDGEVVDGLSDVLEALPTKNSFAILNFLIHPDPRLGGRKPIDLLKAGESARVVEAARRYGEQGS
jgi:hypothetical protein